MSTSPPPPRQRFRSRGRLGWSSPGQPQQLPLWLWNRFRRHGFKLLLEVGVWVWVWVGYVFRDQSTEHSVCYSHSKYFVATSRGQNHKSERPKRVQTLIIFCLSWRGSKSLCLNQNHSGVDRAESRPESYNASRCDTSIWHILMRTTIALRCLRKYWCLTAIAEQFQKLR